tara:strand:+ start:101 stop:598 length:498 start_codon:yes stop_codon:yes gene_type:complete
MDAQMTSAEFDAEIARNRLLAECKQKGFARLATLGHFSGGIKLSKKKAAPDNTPEEFAQEASRLVNEGVMSISAAADKFGRNSADLRYYCNKFGLALGNKRKRRKTWDYDAMLPKIQRLINRKGLKLAHAAQKLECSTFIVTRIITAKGYKYDPKAIKIRKAKKS